MTTPILSTAYLPSVLYMAMLAQHGNVCIEQHETFPKQTYRNRADIVTGNGLLTLVVPIVHTQGNHTQTSDIGISYQEPWNIRHWRAIVSAYSAAPYFLYYRDGLEAILMQRYERLLALNDAVLRYLIQKLKLPCQVSYSETFSTAANNLGIILTNKHIRNHSSLPPYSQVFEERHGFIPNVTVLDLLFNLGPEAKNYLIALDIQSYI